MKWWRGKRLNQPYWELWTGVGTRDPGPAAATSAVGLVDVASLPPPSSEPSFDRDVSCNGPSLTCPSHQTSSHSPVETFLPSGLRRQQPLSAHWLLSGKRSGRPSGSTLTAAHPSVSLPWVVSPVPQLPRSKFVTRFQVAFLKEPKEYDPEP